MKRVSIRLTHEQLATLRRHAEANRQSLPSVVRRAVDDWIAHDSSERIERALAVERALAGVGGFHSGLGDLAERHDDYFGDD